MVKAGIGTFFLGRVIKIGTLNTETFIQALVETQGILSKKYKWIITDRFYYKKNEIEYFYGKLAKYTPDGETLVVDETQKKNVNDNTPNLIIASAPFIYIPKYSGICYLKTWNQIDEDIFKNRISEIILKYHEYIFVDIEINDVVDNFKFIERMKELDKIYSIDCTINKPNPLYGDLWKKLKDYLVNRNSETLALKEETSKSEGIKSILNSKKISTSKNTELLDSAIYMAMDGYGRGTLRGKIKGEEVVLKTGSNPIQLKLNKDINPDEMYEIVEAEFKKINKVRGIQH